MEIGDRLYCVNRDDRYSSVEDHNFKIFECFAKIKVNDWITLRYFSDSPRAHSLIPPDRVIDDMQKEEVSTLKYYPRDTVFVTKNDDIVAAVNEVRSRENFYVEKVDATDEILNLVRNELESEMRKLEDLAQRVDRMKEIVKDLE